jgi:hypothetical protein
LAFQVFDVPGSDREAFAMRRILSGAVGVDDAEESGGGCGAPPANSRRSSAQR